MIDGFQAGVPRQRNKPDALTCNKKNTVIDINYESIFDRNKFLAGGIDFIFV